MVEFSASVYFQPVLVLGELTQQLYELVWSKPLTTLEKEYQVAANDIHRVCKEFQIPLPKSGHWTKLQFGKKVPWDSLPDNETVEQTILLEAVEKTAKSNIGISSNKTQRKANTDQENSSSIKVPEHLSRPDPLVEATRKYFNRQKSSRHGHYDWDYSAASETLNIHVATELIPRALRIMDTIIKVFRKKNYPVRVSNRETIVVIEEQEIKISLREKRRRELVKDKHSWQTAEYYPTGLLVFQIKISYQYTEWIDGKSLLEDQIDKIIAGIELKARREREERLAIHLYWEKEREKERKKAELQKRKDEELQKFKSLLRDAKRWRDAKLLRDYIEDMQKNNSGNNSTEFKQWYEWALGKANWYDPKINGPDELLGDASEIHLCKKSDR